MPSRESSLTMRTRSVPSTIHEDRVDTSTDGKERTVGYKHEKIIDKIRASIREKRPFYSFEFFPPKTQPGVRI